MLQINHELKPEDLKTRLDRLWELSGKKIKDIEANYDTAQGSPVYTVKGKYTTRGWTEWTQGFQFGSSLLQFDATGEKEFLETGRSKTLDIMAPHLTHTGVHDHGFNNVSTYGNLLRLMIEGKTEYNEWERNFYELALKVSGAVQSNRWTNTSDGGGYMYTFNGPHSLFVDTVRTCRVLALAHSLGHVFLGEHDSRIDLLGRMLKHMDATAKYSVFYGEGRDSFDEWGRTVHECIFNVNDGNFRCPNAQQGYSGYTTWTRGLSWAMCGFPEELEFLDTLGEDELKVYGGKKALEERYLKAARASCDFFINNTPTDGIPYWDAGAPNLHKMGDYLNQPADPYNDYEPVDSTAAAIGAQGLLRLGKYLSDKGEKEAGEKYFQAGLTVVSRLLEDTYMSTEDNHQGLLLHSIYHHPNGWDHIPGGSKIPYGESSMWGDYHIREVALYIHRLMNNEPYYTFFNCLKR
jgi:hypothetical protein